METLTYVLLFAALLMIAAGGVVGIVLYDRHQQKQQEIRAKENHDGR